jgi:hypothetical protein
MPSSLPRRMKNLGAPGNWLLFATWFSPTEQRADQSILNYI